MAKLPEKYIIDTNVPKVANLTADPQNMDEELIPCANSCYEIIKAIMANGKTGGIVLDMGDEIFAEYRKQLQNEGEPGIGNTFFKWLHDNRWYFPETDRVTITKQGDSYKEFPTIPDIAKIDISDRKFFATANAHNIKPPIIEAIDSKWWSWKEKFKEVGITILFPCEDYIEKKCNKKLKDEDIP